MRKGFTLLEVMVALAILATALVILLSHQAASISLGNEARVLTKATLIAQERMAELMARRDLRVGEETGEVEDIPPFRWRTTVTEAEREGMLRLRVVVDWKEGERGRKVELTAYVCSKR